jgi:hypothetical protein
MNETPNQTATSEQFQLGIRLEGIFMPYARKQRDALYTSGVNPTARFVHYTSAEAALSIIESKRVWMRNTTCMSDYREVQHGLEMLNKFFADGGKKEQFYAALDTVSPNIAAEAVALFNQWWRNIRFSTYIASISEHDDKEDAHGRLSMWRAFGGNTARVAIVFRVPWFTDAQEKLNVMFSPVAYLREEEAHSVIDTVIKNIRESLDFLRTVDRPTIVGFVFQMLIAGVTCLKHEGFHEEREWRAIYTPDLRPSPLMESSVEVIGGVPQVVYKLPLDSRVSDALEGLDMVRMFDRLIIGPSQFSWAMFESFARTLKAIGIEQLLNATRSARVLSAWPRRVSLYQAIG